MLAADNWCVKVNEKIYGPYSSSQLRKFVEEGRFAAWSMVSPAGGRTWREAGAIPTFAGFFARPEPSHERRRNHVIGRPFGRMDGGPRKSSAGRRHVPVEPAQDPVNPAKIGQSNFIIVFDVVNAAASRVEAAILSLGPGFRIADNVWTLTSELTAIGVRNAIAPYLFPRETIFVVDATHGRSAWQNYTPRLQSKLNAAWLEKFQ